MNNGAIAEPIDIQHKKTLELAQDQVLRGHLNPFYAVETRQPNIGQRVRDYIAPAKFCAIKIYPNPGYYPDNETLMQTYKFCAGRDAPVITYCSAGGVWKFGLEPRQRVETSHPYNYEKILE